MSASTSASPTSAPSSEAAVSRARVFVTTHWSLVLAAGRSDTPRAEAALEKLCRTYWHPVYAHVRRRGYSPEDAQDLTQAFFARLLAGRSLANATPGRGRFRSFLLGALNHCLADESARRHAQKRGGARPPIPLDLADAGQRIEWEPARDAAPDLAFDRHWATALLNEVLDRLENEYRRQGKTGLFDALKQTLIGARESQPYGVLAGRLGLNEGAVKTAVHRLRRRYRELIREEIAQTVSSPGEVNEEIRYLFKVSAAGG